MSQFYLTLPSNSSGKYYVNTLARFKTRLPTPISLTGDWEVGLSEIMFTRNWYNVHKLEGNASYAVFTCTDCPPADRDSVKFPGNKVPYSVEVRLNVGYYDSPERLVEQFQSSMNAAFSTPIPSTTSEGKFLLIPTFLIPTIKYNSLNMKCVVSLPPNTTLKLAEDLAYTLGFSKKQHSLRNDNSDDSATFRSHNTVDIDQSCHALFVYTDVVEATVVGDTLSQLLRIVDGGTRYDKMVHRTYDRPRYFPLQKKNFDTLELSINTNTGALAPFESGTVVVVLHFRERKQPYFLQ